MLFFSELLGKQVYTEERRPLGKLRDVLFLNAETPKITKIVVTNENRSHAIPVMQIKTLGNRIVVKRNGEAIKSPDAELSTAKALLDKQIIDLVGNKVVRANDVVFQDVPTLSVSGIDIGLLGILRRISLEDPVQRMARLFNAQIPMQLLSWGDILNLELDYGHIQIKQREEKLAKIHEEDLADYLELTNTKNIHKFLHTLDTQKAAEVLESLTINYQADLFRQFDPLRGAQLITLIDPDEAVDILLAIERKQRDKIMQALTLKKREELHRLMTFSRTPVGKLMTSEYFAVNSQVSAGEIFKMIRKETIEFSSLMAIYVLNRDDQLVGVFTPHELLMQKTDTPAYKFMVPEPIVLLLTTPIEVVIYKFLKYKISSLPVINRDKQILGVITMDDVSDILLSKIQ